MSASPTYDTEKLSQILRETDPGDLRNAVRVSSPLPSLRFDPTPQREVDHASRRLWSAIMLTPDLDTCRSICAGRPVLAARLEYEAARRAVRGRLLPDYRSYVEITPDMLDAVHEAGVLRG